MVFDNNNILHKAVAALLSQLWNFRSQTKPNGKLKPKINKNGYS